MGGLCRKSNRGRNTLRSRRPESGGGGGRSHPLPLNLRGGGFVLGLEPGNLPLQAGNLARTLGLQGGDLVGVGFCFERGGVLERVVCLLEPLVPFFVPVTV